jgi:hypothetical protein
MAKETLVFPKNTNQAFGKGDYQIVLNGAAAARHRDQIGDRIIVLDGKVEMEFDAEAVRMCLQNDQHFKKAVDKGVVVIGKRAQTEVNFEGVAPTKPVERHKKNDIIKAGEVKELE